MTFPVLQFVDAPSATANVLLDLNNTGGATKRYPLLDGFTVGSPELVGDVDAIDPLYNPRVLAWTERIDGPKSAAITLQSQIARLLLSGPGWLRFQYSPLNKVVYFRTYRPNPGDLALRIGAADSTVDTWDIAVSIPAEAFAYGERVTAVSSVTVNNNPAAGTNPMRLVLPTIVGDAPAPLRVQMLPSDRSSAPLWRRLISVHAGVTSRSPVLVDIGTSDGFNTGADTNAGTTDSAYVGGSYRAISFATVSTMAVRVSGAWTSTPPIGRYKALVRVARSDTSSTFAVRFGVTDSRNVIYSTEGTVPFAPPAGGTNLATWLDLGSLSTPPNTPSDGSLTASAAVPIFELDAQRLSGTGSLYVDAVLLLPEQLVDTVEARTLVTGCFSVADASTTLDTWDGDLETYWRGSGTTVTAAPAPTNIGTFPRVVPGVANTLMVMLSVNPSLVPPSTPIADVITSTATVTASYYPRYLYIGDS